MAPRTRDAFSISKMKEIFDDCSETLLAAIKRQNPDVNADQFDMALRQLVMNFGGTSSLYPDMPGVLASIQTQTPIYSEAADLLIVAREEFKSGNTEESLRAFILALEVPESGLIFEAMAHNNEQAKAAVIDNSIDAEPNLVNNGNSAEDEENWEDTPLYEIQDPDDNLDNPDDVIDADGEDVEAKIRLIAGQSGVTSRHTPTDDTDEDNEDNESEEDEPSEDDEDDEEENSEDDDNEDDDNDNEDDPMGGTSTTKVESADRQRFMLRVARNKISSTGTDAARERADALRKAG